MPKTAEGVSHKKSKGKIISGFREKLRKFYGRLNDSDIEIHEGRPNFVDVYIMGNSSYPPEKIMGVIKEFLPDALSSVEILSTSAVNVNYSALRAIHIEVGVFLRGKIMSSNP